MNLRNVESMTTSEFAEMISRTLNPDNQENVTTDTLTELISSITLVLQRLPNVPLRDLSNLTDKLAENQQISEHDQKPFEIYKGIPVHLYQDGQSDEWKAAVEWYGRLAKVDLEESEKPTRETVLKAAQRLINLLEDTRDNGLVWPDNYFMRKQI